jgi:hypothetical protein
MEFEDLAESAHWSHAANDMLENPLLLGICIFFVAVWALGLAVMSWIDPKAVPVPMWWQQSDRRFAWVPVCFFGAASGALRFLTVFVAIFCLALLGVESKALLLSFALAVTSVIVVGASKLQARFLYKPSFAQSVVTVLVHTAGLYLASKIFYAIFDLEHPDVPWSFISTLEFAIVVAGLSFGWRLPPSPVVVD